MQEARFWRGEAQDPRAEAWDRLLSSIVDVLGNRGEQGANQSELAALVGGRKESLLRALTDLTQSQQVRVTTGKYGAKVYKLYDVA